MGYGDKGYGDDDSRRREGARDGDPGGRWERERSSYGSWGSDRDREAGREQGRGRGGDWGRGREDQGFMERAGERVRSWFSDDDDHHRGRGYREGGQERHHGRDTGGPGRESFGAGFGNQRGWRDERWDRDFGPAEGYDHPENHRRSEGEGSREYGIGRGDEDYGVTMRGAGNRGNALAQRMGSYEGGFSGSYGGLHDPHYSEWRQRQIDELDRDYEEFRRENQSRFEQEFGAWRQKRSAQRQLLGRITPQMDVVGSDGQHVGTVDKVLDDRIILSRSDAAAGGVHHSVPCSWVETVEGKVMLGKTAEEAMAQWRDEDSSRALFERHDQRRGGPHVLNRSFSGTYDEGEDKKR